MKQAIMPVRMLERTIGHMAIGETGYTVPWALSVDADLRCWINPKFTIHRNNGGTVQMIVERTADGYMVSVPPEYRFHPEWNVPESYLPVGFRGAS